MHRGRYAPPVPRRRLALPPPAVSPAEDLVYAIVGSTTHLSVIDAAGHALLHEIEVGAELTGLALSPSGERAYLSAAVGGRLVVVDLPSRSVIVDTVFTNPIDGFVELPTETATGPDGTVFVSYVAADGRT